MHECDEKEYETRLEKLAIEFFKRVNPEDTDLQKLQKLVQTAASLKVALVPTEDLFNNFMEGEKPHHNGDEPNSVPEDWGVLEHSL